MAAIDPVALARDLIRRPSVTPRDEGALDVLQAALEPHGFACHRLRFSDRDTPDVDNLYARAGRGAPHFCFAGHSDVVPVGDPQGWTVDPFAGEIIGGKLWGRGAADMKGAIAAFAAAAAEFLAARGAGFGGSISLLITGDEEGPAVNGTAKVLDWLRGRDERFDACVVGEPTGERELGDMIKIGRRGSMTGALAVLGQQGHVAYPHLADNPTHRIARMIEALIREPLDGGNEWFQPSSLQVTTIDVRNPASNVIPARAEAVFNIRFNDSWTSERLKAWVKQRLDAQGGRYELAWSVSGEAFLTEPGKLSALVAGAIEATLGRTPRLSTTGGTSDARFIRAHAPVVEFGLVGQTMHKVDERAPVAEIRALAAAYRRVLDGYFAGA